MNNKDLSRSCAQIYLMLCLLLMCSYKKGKLLSWQIIVPPKVVMPVVCFCYVCSRELVSGSLQAN